MQTVETKQLVESNINLANTNLISIDDDKTEQTLSTHEAHIALDSRNCSKRTSTTLTWQFVPVLSTDASTNALSNLENNHIVGFRIHDFIIDTTQYQLKGLNQVNIFMPEYRGDSYNHPENNWHFTGYIKNNFTIGFNSGTDNVGIHSRFYYNSCGNDGIYMMNKETTPANTISIQILNPTVPIDLTDQDILISLDVLYNMVK